MFPAFVRSRAIRVVVLALVALMVSPFAGADDYAFLHDGPADSFRPSTTVSAEGPMVLAEDSGESHEYCSCCVCALSLGESFSPEVFSPQAGELLADAPVHSPCSSFLSDIYRPPIA